MIKQASASLVIPESMTGLLRIVKPAPLSYSTGCAEVIDSVNDLPVKLSRSTISRSHPQLVLNWLWITGRFSQVLETRHNQDIETCSLPHSICTSYLADSRQFVYHEELSCSAIYPVSDFTEASD